MGRRHTGAARQTSRLRVTAAVVRQETVLLTIQGKSEQPLDAGLCRDSCGGEALLGGGTPPGLHGWEGNGEVKDVHNDPLTSQ